MSFTLPDDSDVWDADLATKITSLSTQPVSTQGRFCDLFSGLHHTEGMVALKRPRLSQRDQHSDVARRFLREVKTWRDLNHPNVLRFLGACKIGQFMYLVSPYMRNGTIMDFIHKHPQRADRVQLVHEVASALEYLHAQNVIHGDLKGNNILMSDEEHALLCDFGLARVEDASTSKTAKGAGAVRWQAPEIWDSASKSFKTDVYAFSMTIVEIFSGDVPFKEHSSDLAVITAVFTRNERPLREAVFPSTSISYEWLWNITTMCWHRDPDRRPPMSRVKSLLDCEPTIPPPTVLHPAFSMPSLSAIPQHLRPFIAPHDPFPRLPPIVLSMVFCHLSLQGLITATRVCRLWNLRINTDPAVWATWLKDAGLWRGGVPEAVWVNRCFKLRAKYPNSSADQILTHPYKTLFKARFTTWNRWMLNEPKETRIRLDGASIDSSIRLFQYHIVFAAHNSTTTSLYSLVDPQKVQFLKAQKGVVSILDVCSRRRRTPAPPTDHHVHGPRPETHRHDLIVTGSVNGIIRMWDLHKRRNTHTFTASSHRMSYLAIARPVWVEVHSGSGVKEKWPKHHMLIASQAGELVIWRVPGPYSAEYHADTTKKGDILKNPYYVRTLNRGSYDCTESVAVHGRTIAAAGGSYPVRIWDLITGECKHTLTGHTGLVRNVALDPVQKRVFSQSADSIRIWSLEDGTTLGVLVSPTPDLLMGRFCLSTNALVARNGENLLSWDLTHIDPPNPRRLFRDTQDKKYYERFEHLCHDEKIILGSGQELKVWDASDGTLIRQMPAGGDVQRIAVNRRFCVAVIKKRNEAGGELVIWDFGGDHGANENDEANTSNRWNPYDENCLAEEDAEFSDSEDEGED